MANIWNRNSDNRTNLHNRPVRTIKFKSLFTGFDDWKQALSKRGVNPNDIKESDYLILEGALGDSYLRYKTVARNLSYIAVKFRDLLNKSKRQQEFYNNNIKEYLKSDVESENKFFTINKSNQQVVTADYLEHATQNKNVSNGAMVHYINQIVIMNNMQEPELYFILNLAKTICYPLQNQITNEELGGY